MIEPRPIVHAFVDELPGVREEGTLYISIRFRTAIHNCFCGCGAKIVTPIRPTKWRLAFDGDSVSLSPSVGNWSYPCRSHYIIKNGVAIPAGDMPQDEIAAGRARDRRLEDRYFERADEREKLAAPAVDERSPQRRRKGFLNWLLGKK